MPAQGTAQDAEPSSQEQQEPLPRIKQSGFQEERTTYKKGKVKDVNLYAGCLKLGQREEKSTLERLLEKAMENSS